MIKNNKILIEKRAIRQGISPRSLNSPKKKKMILNRLFFRVQTESSAPPPRRFHDDEKVFQFSTLKINKNKNK